jgi:hypothetical protein
MSKIPQANLQSRRRTFEHPRAFHLLSALKTQRPQLKHPRRTGMKRKGMRAGCQPDRQIEREENHNERVPKVLP